MLHDKLGLNFQVQHPEGRFPDYDANMPPRSATLAIRRSDGGPIAL